jgi:hypothetical protein
MPAKRFVDVGRAGGVVAADVPVFRVMYKGTGKNRDTVLHADELRARVRAHACFRLTWHAPAEMPEHPSWARDMPAARRRAGEAIARAIEARLDAWDVRPYDAALPPFYPGAEDIPLEEGWAIVRPSADCRVAFPVEGASLGPYSLHLDLAFAKAPTRDRVAAIAGELRDIAAGSVE